MTIDELQKEIIEEFTVYDDWMDRYQYLIDLSKELSPIDDKYKISQNLIKGCQSSVWLNAELIDGKVIYAADSDALITKGIVSMLIKVLSCHTPKEIIEADLYFIDAIGLKENLSPTRSNGLVSMIKQMKGYAMAYQYKQEQL